MLMLLVLLLFLICVLFVAVVCSWLLLLFVVVAGVVVGGGGVGGGGGGGGVDAKQLVSTKNQERLKYIHKHEVPRETVACTSSVWALESFCSSDSLAYRRFFICCLLSVWQTTNKNKQQTRINNKQT